MSLKRPRLRARNGPYRLALFGVVAIGMSGCSSGPSGPDLNPDFMVGDWVADSLVMTSVANPEVTADLLALGAVFTLSVQPSGRYIAILEAFGQSPPPETGKLTVDGPHVVFMAELPERRESLAVWERVGDSVVLEGDSEYDFNLDGTTEAAMLRQVLIPD